MRRILAATLPAATVLTPTASYAAEGCVTEYFLGGGDDTEGQPIVARNPDGSITIYPPDPPAARDLVLALVLHVDGFVDCVI